MPLKKEVKNKQKPNHKPKAPLFILILELLNLETEANNEFSSPLLPKCGCAASSTTQLKAFVWGKFGAEANKERAVTAYYQNNGILTSID